MRVVTTQKVPIKLWLEDMEESAMSQACDLANLPFVYKWISIMPDSHCGYGMPIGGVMATRGVIVPNAVGVDIGCGVAAAKLSINEIDNKSLKTAMGIIREKIPVGFSHNKDEQSWFGFYEAPDIEVIQKNLASARRQLGTLGGGNHFIEIQHGDDGHIWLMIHSGSRNFGFKTANEYHNKAKELCSRWHSDLPNADLSFLPMDVAEGKEYYEAMNYCLKFAKANRSLMMEHATNVFYEMLGATIDDEIDIHHNYAALEHHYGKNVLVHRKGATKATSGIDGLIPGSMGTSSYVVTGLGNPESFMSCSHGAGRRMGRKQAKATLDLTAEQDKMSGIVHGIRSEDDLDEAPGAYKDIDRVMEDQRDLVKIRVKLSPLGVIKG